MRKSLWAAGVAAAALFPSIAFAQDSCQQQRDRQATGTVVGAVAGAVLGNAVAKHGGKTGGTIIGGVAGAVLGNRVAKATADCAHAYGYYDSNGQWHANQVAASDAAGYYDRDGRWVEGTPDGYYDNSGRWVAGQGNNSTSGYYDGNGRWVPASSNGYYDSNGQYVAGTASGYYDNGRWIAGPVRGHYDSNGRWMSGDASGHRDERGMWIADPQPGYYDENGRWRAGQATGYYDTRGRWTSTSGMTSVVVVSNGPVANPGYGDRRDDRWADAGQDTQAREAWLDRRIRAASANGRLDRREARRAMYTLSSIRNDDARMRRRHGQLSERGQMEIQQRLDALATSVRADTRD